MLKTFAQTEWQFTLPDQQETLALDEIELGHVLFFPSLEFKILVSEEMLLSPSILSSGSKNVSYNPETQVLRGTLCANQSKSLLLGMMDRFATQARTLIDALFPYYRQSLEWGKTSFRPIEAQNRKAASYRKDDTRLHVDAFASQPVQGRRLLRVFSNINPENKPRIWRVGEPFETVAQRFVPHLPRRPWMSPTFLKLFRITKGYRTRYDHLMLHLHNAMKADLAYQKTAEAQEVQFPSQSTWVVMTDKTSHAVLSGQYMLEQTFYLPPSAMASPGKAPLGILENLLQTRLV